MAVLNLMGMHLHRIFLSIGSNLGDPMHHCRMGIDALDRHASISVVDRSPFYRTQPVDYLDQQWFINAAVRIESNLAPEALLCETQAIQRQFGRKSDTVRFGPRTLDIDIIFFDDRVIHTPHLTIPHPRMHKRRFVLQPICDIDPKVIHPLLGMSVQNLLNQLVIDDQEIIACSSD